ncbi:MAG: GMC family oxidoreductase N-terminal domain-containing protein [Hyphomicrobiaceae bacterium]|nr:GMC family oxidoreductase N-terminal domain-containing protein [Hyphomicrobiaceae bacterium]
MSDPESRGESINALVQSAYAGRIGRRTFLKGLLALGVAAAVARDMADHAAHAQANQKSQLAALKREYDYIVVGAGSAGCVLAHRLSENGRHSVLVIEGGGTNLDQDKIVNPLLYTRNFGTDTDWGNKTVPQKHMMGRTIAAPLGKIIGGGSSINATVWLKGDKSDYDTWAQVAGPGWGFASVIRGLKRAERYAGGEGELRGGSGMIAVRKPALDHPVTLAFMASAIELGKQKHIDVNNVASLADVTGQQDVNADGSMRRITTAHAYLLPALVRSNLTLLPSATVTKLEIKGGDCQGVSVSVDGKVRRFSARREVILSAGALHSPKILMLSGIGPARHLREIGIPVLMDVPGIGSNLQDHLLARVLFEAKDTLAPRLDTGHSGIAYHRSDATLPGPDIQVYGRSEVPGLADLKPNQAFAILAGLMKPRSRGTVRLTSPDPSALLAVDPNYLEDPADLEAFITAIEFAMAIGNARGFEHLRKQQITLPRADRGQIAQYLRTSASTYWHYVGTCAMGRHASAPVDEALRLRGVRRLRVIDASVIPTIPSCNTHAPLLALAERAAEIVLGAA